MIMVFENKHGGRVLEVKDVSMFTTDCTCLGARGYGVNYKDGTFSLYAWKEWKLILVKEDE